MEVEREETIDGLVRERRREVQSIELAKKRLAGIDERLKLKIQESIDALSEEGVDVEGLSLEEKKPRGPRGSYAPRLPHGFWEYALAKYFLDTGNGLTVTARQMREFLGWPNIPNPRIAVALSSKIATKIVVRSGEGVYSIREGTTRVFLQGIVDSYESKGMSLKDAALAGEQREEKSVGNGSNSAESSGLSV